MSNVIYTITVRPGDLWKTAVAKAYERMRLDPRVREETIRAPELIGGPGYENTWQVTADTKGGDVLKILIKWPCTSTS